MLFVILPPLHHLWSNIATVQWHNTSNYHPILQEDMIWYQHMGDITQLLQAGEHTQLLQAGCLYVYGH